MWEYLTAWATLSREANNWTFPDGTSLIAWLDDVGSEGWEVVSAVPTEFIGRARSEPEGAERRRESATELFLVLKRRTE